ncbi:MAG: hypothetical protein ACOYJU_00450 [Anaerovoracaceae bacterium]|jgi:hypothetical protein
MGSHLLQKNTGKKIKLYTEEKVFLVLIGCFVLALMLYLLFLFFYPNLRNAPARYSEEQWESTEGSISFTMIDKTTVYEGREDYDKPLGEIVLNGETVPVRVTFREHDPIMWIHKDTERVKASSKGYHKDALLKYECKYWRGKFKATLIRDYTDNFNGDLDQLTFIRTKKGRQVVR